MPTSRVTDILHVKHAAFLIAVITTSLAMESRSAEVIPPKPDRAFNDYAGVASKEAAYRFNQKLAQFERETSDQVVVAVFPKMQSDSGIADYTQRVAQAGGVSPNDRRGEHQGPGRILNPNPNDNPKHNPTENQNPNPNPVPPSPWFLIVAIVLIVIALIVERERPPKPPNYPLRIAIKFKSDGGKPPQQLDGLQASLKGTVKPLAPLQVLPLFESLSSKRLSELVDRARRTDPDYKPVDFSAWFQVETPAGVNADELAKHISLNLANVETAYVMRPSPPQGRVSSKNDPHNPKQHYQDAAPIGIDARYAWGFLGGDGAGIGFVDLEQGWNLNHKDLPKITIISGENSFEYPHGTAVLGEVLMVDNTRGGVGIAPSASGRVVSFVRNSSLNTADAILDAYDKMSYGDVLLLEVQEDARSTSDWPAEILQANYDAIYTATAAGVVVVEAGGNGDYNLDAYTDNGKKILDRRSRDFREDSGAIIVGAGCSDHPHGRFRSSDGSSNYGNRIDCYAWGENIETTTTNLAGTRNAKYIADFGGTSGASAIVAGVALIVQGIAQFSLGRRLSPRELRDLLTTNGTPSATPATDKIGVMPDLQKIIANTKVKLNAVPIPTPDPS
jgi:Subtilase family